MPPPLNILILEDNPGDARLLAHELQSGGVTCVCERVETEAAFLAALANPPDLILADYQVPGFGALPALKALRQRGLSVPVIVVTGAAGDEAAVACLHEGATDYLLKDRLGRLTSAVLNAIEQRRLQRAERTAQETLRAREALFRALVENSPTVVSLLLPDATVRYVSLSVERVLGYDKEEFEGRNAFAYLDPEEVSEVRARFEECLERPGIPLPGSFRYRHRDGSYRQMAGVAHNRLQEPEVGAVVLTFWDITKRRQAEEERSRLEESLRRNEMMSAMGALVGGVAHEVRNPLFAISAMLDAFEERFEVDAESQNYLVLLRQQVERLSGLMRELLEYGKPSRLSANALPLSQPLRSALETCRSLAEERRVRIRNLSPEVAPTLVMDEERVAMVFKNLIENAVQHSPAGGEVTLRVECFQRKHEDWVRCYVEDSGQGFSKEDLPHVFEPFFSRRQGGTGLGLSIVRRIVDQHGGTVRARNLAGGGAVLSLEIPVAPPSEGEKEKEKE